MRAMLLAGLVAGTAWSQETQFEVSLQPVRVQVNGKFTQHLGTFGTVSWSPRNHIALQVLGGGNWYNEESDFNLELVEKYRVEAQFATSLLWTWGLFAGLEMEPFVGEFTLFDGPHAQLGFVVSAGAGAGGTRHLLKPATETPPTYGDTGVRFMATVAAGLRFRVGEHFTARLELRDVGFSAAINGINGCSVEDLSSLDRRFRQGIRDPGTGPVSDGCRGFGNHNEVSVGHWLAQHSSSDVIHNLGVALGAGFSF